MKRSSSNSPIIYEYLKRYQDDPTSRVFAPLAEAYRKAGMAKDAVEIAREGLRVHPGFIGGRVALARALFDLGQVQEVVNELAPVIQDVPDNLVAQKLLGDSYLMLGRLTDALACYKMVHYFYPMDEETSQLIQELESQAYEKGTLVLRTDVAPLVSEFQAESQRRRSEGEDTIPGVEVKAGFSGFKDGAEVSSDRGAGAVSDRVGSTEVKEQADQLGTSQSGTEWVHQVETLQTLLQRVERYRALQG